MAVTSTNIFPQSVNNAGLAVVNATGTTVTSFITAGTNGSRIDWINAATSDTSVNNVTFYLNNGSISYPIGVVQIPAGSGNTYSVPPIAVLNVLNSNGNTYLPTPTFDANGNKFLYLAAGWSLMISVLAAVTSAKQLTLTAQYENF